MKSRLLNFSILLFIILSSLACSSKKKSYEDYEKERLERQQEAEKVLTDELCTTYRDSVLLKYFGKDYKLTPKDIKKVTYQFCCFCNEGSVDGSFKGTSGTYEYSMEVNVNRENPKDWQLWRFRVKDTSTGLYVYIIDVGEEQATDYYNKEAENSTSNTASFDLSKNEVEDMLQRQWDIENASSPVGAESSNVFNVHIDRVSSSEVNVSYDLRSTYSGQKKFVHLSATLKPNSEGKWEVSNLGY